MVAMVDLEVVFYLVYGALIALVVAILLGAIDEQV